MKTVQSLELAAHNVSKVIDMVDVEMLVDIKKQGLQKQKFGQSLQSRLPNEENKKNETYTTDESRQSKQQLV